MKRYVILKNLSLGYFFLSTLLRIVFIIWQIKEIDLNILAVLKTFFIGLCFDIGTISFFWSILGIYLLFYPKRWIGNLVDKCIIHFFISLTIFILVFSFFSEITFWEEFKSRFNFVAVDYLIYTNEVFDNINQSYPLHLIIPAIILFTLSCIFYLHKTKSFERTFQAEENLKNRLLWYIPALAISLIFTYFIENSDAEWSQNRFNSEISKTGIYSFFAALRNNQMDYNVFYSSINNDNAINLVKNKLRDKSSTYSSDKSSIKRNIIGNNNPKPNVVLILMESMSSYFMTEFKFPIKITPTLDQLSNESIYFNNLYATGTRTVRGMEAVTLCIPPTPGSSIVKRPNNQNLYTINNIFKEKGYSSNFFYGGDGYFDNMNSFFGGNGFEIYDKSKGSILSDKIKTKRYQIKENEITFENAWGICDEDIYNKMIKVANEKYAKRKNFFNFIMTTSNHKPYTFPNYKNNYLEPGLNREAAVMYADYALGQFLKNASKQPWFKNTVFVIVADHCASSAGRDEIDVINYHIPAFIYSPLIKPQKVKKLCSQIDLMPTLFSLLNWNYTSNFFGKNILDSSFEERAFVGTYLKLGLLKKNNKIMVLSNQKKNHYYQWNRKTNGLTPLPIDKKELEETISYYQSADYLFMNNKLK